VVEDGTRIVKTRLPFAGDISYANAANGAQAYAENIQVKDGSFHFDYKNGDIVISDIKLGIPGTHNVENAVAAITVALLLGIDQDKIVTALGNFKGIKRRFEYIVRNEEHVYIDDYAHHPEELRAFIGSMRQLYPNKKLTVVFQPHLFSRTRDFVDGFAEVLSRVDELLLMEIYPARELPIEGVDSQWLLSKLSLDNKRVASPQEVLDIIATEKPELIVTVGAGDIDKLVKPIKAILDKK
jgi:UDP-N-acetylmuramate--alanine ligase